MNRERFPKGTSFLFVGKFSTMTREQARAVVESLGGKCPSGVNEQLDYLVIGNEDSSLYGLGEKRPKQLKVEALIEAGAPIALISEDDFVDLIGLQPQKPAELNRSANA